MCYSHVLCEGWLACPGSPGTLGLALCLQTKCGINDPRMTGVTDDLIKREHGEEECAQNWKLSM